MRTGETLLTERRSSTAAEAFAHAEQAAGSPSERAQAALMRAVAHLAGDDWDKAERQAGVAEELILIAGGDDGPLMDRAREVRARALRARGQSAEAHRLARVAAAASLDRPPGGDRVESGLPGASLVEEQSRPVRHDTLDMAFQPTVAGMRLQKVRRFNRAGTDMGATYGLAAAPTIAAQTIQITVFVTEERAGALATRFAKEAGRVRTAMPTDFDVGDAETIDVTMVDGRRIDGLRQRFSVGRQALVSELLLFQTGTALVKFRPVYRADERNQADGLIRRFLKEFEWPL